MRSRMVITATVMMTVATLAMAVAPGVCQDNVLLAEGFEDGTGNFLTMDSFAMLSVTEEPEEVYGGNGSLEFAYLQRAVAPGEDTGQMPGTVVMVFDEPLPALSGISFAIWSAESTAVMVVIAEQGDGPRYNQLIWCEAGGWHEFELGVDEFTLDVDGPEDPDGMLTPELVGGIGFIDVSGFLRYLAEMTPMISIADPVDQILRFDDIKILPTSPVRSAPGEGLITICDYDQPRGFLVLGGEDVVVSSEEVADGGSALTVDYQLAPQTLLGVVHAIAVGQLAGATEIRVQVACTAETTLIMTLEEHREEADAPKSEYIAMRQINAYVDTEEIVFTVGDFRLSDDAHDPNGQLDMDLVKSIVIGDITALISAEEISNMLLLDELVAAE